MVSNKGVSGGGTSMVCRPCASPSPSHPFLAFSSLPKKHFLEDETLQLLCWSQYNHCPTLHCELFLWRACLASLQLCELVVPTLSEHFL